MAFGRNFPGGGQDPLFAPYFATATVLNLLPAALAVVRRPAQLVALVKPQFEVGRRRLKKGIVRDEAVHREACDAAADTVAGLGWRVLDIIASPVLGGDGNREFLLGGRRA